MKIAVCYRPARLLYFWIASAMGVHQLHRPRRRVVVAALAAVAIPLESSLLFSTIVGNRFIASCAAFELPRTQHLPPRSDDGSTIAYIHHEPPLPAQNLSSSSDSHFGLVFFPGFLSSMHSSKACQVFRYAQENNLECTVFDRYGHGASRPRSLHLGRIRWAACDNGSVVGR